MRIEIVDNNATLMDFTSRSEKIESLVQKLVMLGLSSVAKDDDVIYLYFAGDNPLTDVKYSFHE